MKKIIQLLIVGIIVGSIGYFIGWKSGYNEAEKYQNLKGIESIKSDLKEREMEMISSLLKGKARIETKKEGGIFNRKEVQYFIAEVRNNSLLAKAKDIDVKVIFLSKTKSEIGDIEFTVYEFIQPGQSRIITKEVNVSDDVAEFRWNVINALAE